MSELEYWKSRLASGNVSRREFIGRAAALGVTTALATTMASKIAGAAPKKGGSLKIALGHGATTDSLDPATYPDQFTGMLGGAIGSALTLINAKGGIEGDLAETMEPT